MRNLIRAMLRLVPQHLATRLDAPMMTRDRLARGRDHPTIRMNLANLLLCSCSSCPSFPRVYGEALYCASGISSVPITEKGCIA